MPDGPAKPVALPGLTLEGKGKGWNNKQRLPKCNSQQVLGTHQTNTNTYRNHYKKYIWKQGSSSILAMTVSYGIV